MAPSRFASLRGRPNLGAKSGLQPQPSIPASSTNDSGSALQQLGGLIAFRYEQTIQAEPPIPILPVPPPCNPLRNNRPPPPAVAAAIDTNSDIPPVPSRATSTSKPTSTSASTPTNTRATGHVVVLPPLAPLANHPALRHQHRGQNHGESSSQHSPSSSTTYDDWKRDSALGTISSASTTLPDDEYTSAKLDSEVHPPSSAYSTNTDGPIPPPRAAPPAPPRPATAADNYSTHHHDHDHDTVPPRISSQSHWSLTESDVSVTDSSREKKSTRQLIRGFSLRLSPPAKRLAAKRQSTSTSEAMRPATAAMASGPRSAPPQSHARHSRRILLQGSPALANSISSPNLPDPVSHPSQEIGHNDSQSPISWDPESELLSPSPEQPRHDSFESQSESGSGFAPTINTNIPQGGLLDDDFLNNIQFSKRGSVYLGGKRVISAMNPRIAPCPMERFADPRAAPAAPISPTGHAMDGRHAKKASVPDIRLMPGDTERESQKVRSLYESTDSIHWQDGAPAHQCGELLESPKEVPSDEADNTAPLPRRRENRKSVRAMYLSPTQLISATSLPSPRDDASRNEFELAGGIEDWEDVHGEDVDRYGFIVEGSGRPMSRASVPAETRSLYATSQKRNGRKVLAKRSRPPPLSQGLSKIPRRKTSAPSLNTLGSALSTSSRRSVRSGIRNAANLLPQNRDRRIVDAAGDMLSLPPGLADTDDQQKSAQVMKAAQDKESRRAEKWRKMAKFVTKGKDDKGLTFVANNVKKDLRIKFDIEDLAKPTVETQTKHFEIQTMEIAFDNTNPKLIERTWKGIPDRWRAAAWYSFLSSSAESAKSEETEEALIAQFHNLQEISSPDDVQIDLDVPRTINRHIMFRKRYRGGQRLLFRVLHSLSLHFPETGYVQGMAALAATLLCYYDEERCFVMLARLWRFRGLERLYDFGFGGLMTALQDLEKHWLRGKPHAKKLKNELEIDPTAFGTRWYLTLFNLSIPFNVQLRVWDVFMLLGGCPPPSQPKTGKAKEKEKATDDTDPKLTFNGLEILHATAAALIDMHKDVIMDGDFENVMKGLTSFQQVEDEDKFMNLVRAEWNMRRGKKRS